MSQIPTDSIQFRCRHCDAALSFPAMKAGRVEDCPECANYVDVPDAPQLRGGDVPADTVLSTGHLLRFGEEEGLPRPRWDLLISELSADIAESDRDDVFTEAARVWLERLQTACGAGYHVNESTNFQILSRLDAEQASLVIRYCETTLARILEVLDGIAADEGFGPHVVMIFDKPYLYYRYVAPFHAEGVYGGSGGMFLNEGGYEHIALPYFAFDWPSTIAHELVHATVSHLPLPLWINEGLTMLVEWHLTGKEPAQVDAEVRGRLRSYWREKTLEPFWSGESFAFDDEGQELSYALAFIVAFNLALDERDKFREFVRTAHYQDAGEKAFANVFGRSLSEPMSRTLGEGDWSPRETYWEAPKLA